MTRSIESFPSLKDSYRLPDEYEEIEAVETRLAPELVTAYQNVVSEMSDKEKEFLEQAIDISCVISPKEIVEIEKVFPNFRKAIWIFAGAPEKLSILSMERHYREHRLVRYLQHDDPEIRTLMLKDTRSGRIEALSADIYRQVGVEAYRVMPVVGGGKAQSRWHWLTLEHVDRDRGEEIIKLVPYQETGYAVVEGVLGEPLLDMNLGLVGQQDREVLFTQYIKNLTCCHILGLSDLSDDEMLVDLNPPRVTHVDRDHTFDVFNETLFIFRSTFDKFHLDIELATKLATEAILEVLRQFVDQWSVIEHMMTTALYSGLVKDHGHMPSMEVVGAVKKQLDRLNSWFSDAEIQ